MLFTPDVKPYEYMKLRLLNGGHSALAYVSILCGHCFVDSAMDDAAVGGFIFQYLESLRACVPPVPGVDLGEYCDTLVRRFSNPYIKDKLARLAEDGSKKLYNTMRGSIQTPMPFFRASHFTDRQDHSTLTSPYGPIFLAGTYFFFSSTPCPLSHVTEMSCMGC